MEKKRGAFVGSWYPGDAGGCLSGIEGYLQEKKGVLPGNFVGGIVPHAGWDYSGSIACRVIASIAGGEAPALVVLLGHHMGPASPVFTMTHGVFETPFGDIPVDDGFVQELMARVAGEVTIRGLSPAAFPDENTLELQLPFIKHFFPGAAILAMGVPPVSTTVQAVARAVVETAKSRKTSMRVLGSTDLTHYGVNFDFTPQGTGKKAHTWVREVNDRAIIRAMVAMDAEKVIQEGASAHNICCPGAAATAITTARGLGALNGFELDYATSYEKNPGSSFVGYAGVLFKLCS